MQSISLFKSLLYAQESIFSPLLADIHTIIPVYKSGDKSLANNYQPISILCNTSKLLEWLLYSKVIPQFISIPLPDNLDFSEIDQLFNNYLSY